LPRSVDHDERRRDIARAAIRLLAKNGPQGLTLRALAEELGGSITLVTHFFPNRRALLDAVTSQVIEDSATDLASFEDAQLAPSERLRGFLMWLLPTTAETLQLERGRVLLSAESDAHFNVQEFFDTWERTIRDLIERYVTPLVPESERQFYIDLLRVVQNGVVLSSVEHPKYWTPEKQIEFIDALVPVIERLSTGPGTRS
jgi:AcrR family transcriptional regulator